MSDPPARVHQVEAFHPQVRIRHGDLDDLVDEELAPLLLELWRAGLTTISSCQDVGESLHDLPERHPHMSNYVAAGRGRAIIDFHRDLDVCSFLSMVANGGELDDLYVRMTDWRSPGAWTVRSVAMDLGVMRGPLPSGEVPPSMFGFVGWQVEFPRSDIPAVTECLSWVRSTPARRRA